MTNRTLKKSKVASYGALRGSCVAATMAVLASCSSSPDIEICRDWVEQSIDAPSTISDFQAREVSAVLAQDFWLSISPMQCEQLNWPAETCQTISAPLLSNDIRREQTVDSRTLAERLADRRQERENAEKEAVRRLQDTQRRVTVVSVEFDASNSFGTPIRHEARCVFKSPSKEVGELTEMDMIDFQTYRGFE